MAPYKAVIHLVFDAPDDRAANELLGHARLGATGALPSTALPESYDFSTEEATDLPEGTALAAKYERINATKTEEPESKPTTRKRASAKK